VHISRECWFTPQQFTENTSLLKASDRFNIGQTMDEMQPLAIPRVRLFADELFPREVSIEAIPQS
jgi:hypothetical protein